eukprot:TRINITY_DN12834_c0_g1_i2.p1 TRINITY_DN12834_c0_g1~~TRINITY_DN12834_c0_g1_i2.p1  ORF type:complete len:785 (+),score=144.15 TRINITY_DN12834_c0_g1_i2:358-2712(+)
MTNNAPYGGPDDDQCAAVEPTDAFPASSSASSRASSSSSSSAASASSPPTGDRSAEPRTPAGQSAPGTSSTLSTGSTDSIEGLDAAIARLRAANEKERVQQKVAEGTQQQKDNELESGKEKNVLAEAKGAAAQSSSWSPPRQLLADPERGGPLQVLLPPRCPPSPGRGTAVSKQVSNEQRAHLPGVAGPGKEPPPAAEGLGKKGIAAKFMQIKQKFVSSVPSAPAVPAGGLFHSKPGVPRAQKLAPEPRRFAGLRAAVKANHAPRPAIGPLGPRKPFKPRPVRPARPAGLACPAAVFPQLHSLGSRPVLQGCPGPQGAAKCADQPPRDISPQVGGERLGSQPGSTVEGTSPGHSPLPEFAPVRYSLAPERSSLPWLGAAYQGQNVRGICCGDDYGCSSPRAGSGYAHDGPGGFRMMAPGEEIKGCKVEHFLGRGAFGEVWLATNRRSGAVALKVSRSGEDYHKEANFERQALAAIDTFGSQSKKQLRLYRERIVRMKSFFKIPGTGGAQHPCMVLEPLGPSVLQLAEKHEGRCVSPGIVKVIMRQVLQALAFLAEMEMAHGDLKLENILLTTRCQQGTVTSKGANRGADLLMGKYHPPCLGESLSQSLMRQYAIKLIDFGKAVFCRYEEVLGPIQTLHYRAPEVVCGSLKLTPAVDTWSAGCICFELLTGDYLFDIVVVGRDELTLHPELWSWWIATLGDPPRAFTRSGAFPLVEDFFDPYGCLKEQTRVRSRTLSARLKEKGAAKGQSQALVHLLPLVGGMLQYLPGDRSTPQEALMSSWLRF